MSSSLTIGIECTGVEQFQIQYLCKVIYYCSESFMFVIYVCHLFVWCFLLVELRPIYYWGWYPTPNPFVVALLARGSLVDDGCLSNHLPDHLPMGPATNAIPDAPSLPNQRRLRPSVTFLRNPYEELPETDDEEDECEATPGTNDIVSLGQVGHMQTLAAVANETDSDMAGTTDDAGVSLCLTPAPERF